MRNEIMTFARRILAAGVGATAIVMTACNPEPDESDLYTFTASLSS